MADHFADRFWATQFWSARYFMAGAIDPNAMTASISGAATVTALLTAPDTEEEILASGIKWKRKREKKRAIANAAKISYADDDEALVAFVTEFLREAA